MKVHNLTNSQYTSPNFQGRIDILPGNLSYEPTKYIRKAYKSMEELIKDKPYNLYIRQDHQNNTVKIIAQTEDNFIKNKGIKAESYMSSSADLYEDAAKTVVASYENKLQNRPQTLGEKIKLGLNKIWHNFLQGLEIEDEPIKNKNNF